MTYAYASFEAPENADCGACDACQSIQFLLRQWMNNTPHIRPIVVALSSPLPLSLSVTLRASLVLVVMILVL
jgi:hypothetical protein